VRPAARCRQDPRRPAPPQQAGKLTPEEFEHIKGHARLGYALLKQHADLAAIVSQTAHGHHERLDGTGYPQGLQEEQIPYFTRIISIVDCFDAITSQRVYDRARSVKDAFKVLMDERERSSMPSW